MDPVSIVLAGTVAGGVGLKLLEGKVVKSVRAKAKTEYSITYYTHDGTLETKQVEAAKVVDGEPFDEHGFRIGYSTHYTRMLEIEISGFGRTPCGCNYCEEEELRERKKSEARKREIEEIELKKRMAEISRRRAERRERAMDRLNKSFDDGELDHLSVRQLMQQGISKDKVVSRINAPIVWPEYAIAGTTEITYEREKVGVKNIDLGEVEVDVLNSFTIKGEDIIYKYYRVEKTMYVTGETQFKRIEIDKEEYIKSCIPVKSNTIQAGTINLGTKLNRDELLDHLEQNRKRNNMYIAEISERKRSS